MNKNISLPYNSNAFIISEEAYGNEKIKKCNL